MAEDQEPKPKRKRNREAERAARKRYYYAHLEHERARCLANYHANGRIGNPRKQLTPEQNRAYRSKLGLSYFRDYRLKSSYGIGLDDVAAMLVAQKFECAICSDSIDEMTRNVDHDHATNTVRALLCSRCNWALGHLRDSPDIARAAAVYLEKHRQPATLQAGAK